MEYKSLSTPRRLREALSQARYVAKGSGLRPMIMTSYLDEETLDSLAREEPRGLDFWGNGVVIAPGRWFVYRSGNPNAYPSSQYIQAIYNGRSSLVGRTLLLRQRFDTVSAEAPAQADQKAQDIGLDPDAEPGAEPEQDGRLLDEVDGPLAQLLRPPAQLLPIR